MNDHEWKIKVSEDISAIKTDIKYIIKNLCPVCKYPEIKGEFQTIKSKLSMDRKLIFLILTYSFTLGVGLFLATYK